MKWILKSSLTLIITCASFVALANNPLEQISTDNNPKYLSVRYWELLIDKHNGVNGISDNINVMTDKAIPYLAQAIHNRRTQIRFILLPGDANYANLMDTNHSPRTDNLNQHIISAAQGSTSLEEFSLNQASPKIMGKLVDFIVMTPSLKSIAFERTFFNYNMAQQLAWAISKSPSLKELKLSDCVEMDMDSFDVLQQAASQKANFSFYQNVVG